MTEQASLSETYDDASTPDEEESLPSPEELDPDRDENADTTASSSSTTDEGYGPCQMCGSFSEKRYKCTECGKPW